MNWRVGAVAQLWRCAALGVLLLVGGARGAQAQGTECDAGEREVRALDFDGNRAFRDSDLSLRVSTTASDFMRRNVRVFGAKRCLDSDALRLDVGRLRLFYRRHGYYDTAVDTSVTSLADGGVRVRFLIREGEPVLVDTLRITGLDGATSPLAETSNLDLRPGVVFDITRLQSAIDSIKARLRNNGYPRADVAASFSVYDSVARRAKVNLEVLPGVRARVGEIRVFDEPLPGAPRRLGDNTVRRLLGVHPGDLYSERELIDAQRALYQSDLFRHVEVGLAADSAQRPDSLVAIDVMLRENFLRQVDTEVGWAVLDCFKARTQLIDKNFLGSARRLELTAQLSKIGYGEPTRINNGGLCAQDIKKDQFSTRLNYFVGSTLRFPTLFGLRSSPSLSIYSERRGEYNAYLRTTLVGGEASITRNVAPGIPLRLGYSLEYGRTDAQPALLCSVFNKCDADSQALITDKDRPLAVASAHLERVRTDNPLNPRVGTAVRLDLRTAARQIGSDRDIQFVKGLSDFSYYRGLTRGITFAARLRAGAVLSPTLSFNDSLGFVPPEERLYAGGATSVRGFQQNELGGLIYIAENKPKTVARAGDTVYFEPADQSVLRRVPVGGNALVVANFELRIRSAFFPELIQYSLFADAGDVWQRGSPDRRLKASSLWLNALKWTPGVGVRVFTPVGPFQANVGYNPHSAPMGAMYYDQAPDREGGVAPLYCVSPGNRLPAVPVPGTTVYKQLSGGSCPATFAPPKSNTFLSRLTFTFSIGPDF
jgi:outer membrane protein assembly complex protein YaeT